MALSASNGRRLETDETLAEKAAAYLYHVTKNHAFVDGNKRTGLACALAFLELNGSRWQASDEDLSTLTLGVASGTLSKSSVAVAIAAALHPLEP